jgi:hypothetical protein
MFKHTVTVAYSKYSLFGQCVFQFRPIVPTVFDKFPHTLFIAKYHNRRYMMEDDIIKLNVALFMRLMELAREDVKDDMSLHFITEIVTRLSQDRVVTMDDYDNIIAYMNKNKKPDELSDIKRLGGIQ